MTDGEAPEPKAKKRRRRRRYRRRLCSAERERAAYLIGGGASPSEVADEIESATPAGMRAMARRLGFRFVEKKRGQVSVVAVMSSKAANDLSLLAEGRETSEAALLGMLAETLMDERDLYRALVERAKK